MFSHFTVSPAGVRPDRESVNLSPREATPVCSAFDGKSSLFKMNFRSCFIEKCGWQAVAGNHGRWVLHTGSAKQTNAKLAKYHKQISVWETLNVIPQIGDIFGGCHTGDHPSLARISELTPNLS